MFKYAWLSFLLFFIPLFFSYGQEDKDTKAKLDIERKASEWVQSLELGDALKEKRIKDVITTHLSSVINWHNNHPYTLVPEGINPKTGDVLSKLDRQLIIDSTLPKDVHTALMTGLRKDLDETQIEAILDKYTVGKVNFTMTGYRAIVPDLSTEEEAVILTHLKQAREEAVDYKNMEEISAIFKIHKTKIELYLYQNGRNWKVIYKDYVDSLKKSKE